VLLPFVLLDDPKPCCHPGALKSENKVNLSYTLSAGQIDKGRSMVQMSLDWRGEIFDNGNGNLSKTSAQTQIQNKWLQKTWYYLLPRKL
jgi:hypothetical protein